MHKKHMKFESALYDPELPNAADVLTSLCCVATKYASEPSMDLASLGFELAQTLNAPEYAESDLVVTVAKQLRDQWQALLHAHKEFEILEHATEFVPRPLTVQ